MSRLSGFALILGAFTFTAGAATAALPGLDSWFLGATAARTSPAGKRIAKPDFMPGNTKGSLCHVGARTGVKTAPLLNGIWELIQYDRAHHIGLAAASTDQCSVAVFKAPAPAVRVNDGDLSGFATGRGVRIGSSYAEVVSLYGAPAVRSARHFAAAYDAEVLEASATTPRRTVKLPEVIIFVIDNGRVSSMTISVDESGLF